MLGILVHVCLIGKKRFVLLEHVHALLLLLTTHLVLEAEVDLEAVWIRARQDLRAKELLGSRPNGHNGLALRRHDGVNDGGDCILLRDLRHILWDLTQARQCQRCLLFDKLVNIEDVRLHRPARCRRSRVLLLQIADFFQHIVLTELLRVLFILRKLGDYTHKPTFLFFNQIRQVRLIDVEVVVTVLLRRRRTLCWTRPVHQ